VKAGLISRKTYDEYASGYHARKGHLWTLLNHSPAHYFAALHGEDKDTPALAFGRAFHCRILEPDRYCYEYIVPPKFDRRTKAGKADAAAWEEEHGHKTTISQEDADTLDRMADAVMAHEDAGLLLLDGEAEVSGYWQDAETLIGCKARYDWLDRESGIFVDLKTTRNAHPQVFGKDAARFGYYMQAALYADGLAAILGGEWSAYYIAVEKTPPYAVAVYQIEADEMGYGRDQYREALRRLKALDLAAPPPAYPGVHKLTPPGWVRADTIFD